MKAKDSDILNFITAHQALFGFPASVREIGKAVGLTSSASVHRRLNILVDKRKLVCRSNGQRTVYLDVPDV